MLYFLLLIISCEAQKEPNYKPSDTIYTYQTPSRDGIGKYYMGREIAHVMGHLGASWLERAERDGEENTQSSNQKYEIAANGCYR